MKKAGTGPGEFNEDMMGRRPADNVEARKQFVAVTRRGERGTVHIVAESYDVDAWARAHAQELIDAGYVRLYVSPYLPGRIVGGGYRYTSEELAALRAKLNH